MGVGDKPDIRFHRERHVEQDVRIPEAPVITTAGAREEEVRKLFSNMEGVKSKAEKLLEEARFRAKTCIPVHELATEVREAVIRRDPSCPDGSKVCIDLYLEAVKRANKRMTGDEVSDYASRLTGNITVDTRVTKGANDPSFGGTGNLGLMDVAKHIVILMLAQQVLAGHTSTEVAKQTAPKLPPTTELAGIASSWLITGITMGLLHKGAGNKFSEWFGGIVGEEAKEALAKEGLTPETFAKKVEHEALKAQATEAPIARLYEEPDWNAIRDYSDDWVANTNQDGYESWSVAGDAIAAGQDLDSSLHEYSRYIHNLTLGQNMPRDACDMLDCKVRGTNTRLDMAAAVLSSHYSADLVCCLVRWLGAFPVSQLKLLRLLLSILANGINLDLASITKRMNDSLRKRLQRALVEPLYHEVRDFFGGICKDIRKWLASDDEKWKQLFSCTPIDEMFEYILRALEHLEKLILRLIEMLWDSIQFRHVDWAAKLGKWGDKKRLTQLLKILNAVIKAIEKGNLCAKEDTTYPSHEEVKTMAAQIMGEIPGAPDWGLGETGDPYRDFNPITFDTPSGIKVPSVVTSAGLVRDVDKVTVQDCMKKLTDENVVPLLAQFNSQELTHVQRLRKFFEEEER